jgi:hypothetical protein
MQALQPQAASQQQPQQQCSARVALQYVYGTQLYLPVQRPTDIPDVPSAPKGNHLRPQSRQGSVTSRAVAWYISNLQQQLWLWWPLFLPVEWPTDIPGVPSALKGNHLRPQSRQGSATSRADFSCLVM